MAIKVQIDKASKIKKRLGIEKNGKAQLFLATEATKRMDKYVPKDSGVLKDSHDIEPHKIIIKNNVFLAFNYSNEIYINNLSIKIFKPKHSYIQCAPKYIICLFHITARS